MIEIIIPYWFGAALLCTLMVVFLFLAVMSAYAFYRFDVAALCIILFFVIDAVAAGASMNYMSTPKVIPCCEECNPLWYNETSRCVYPTINPYEQQPLHPILWFFKIEEWLSTAPSGAINIKHEVV